MKSQVNKQNSKSDLSTSTISDSSFVIDDCNVDLKKSLPIKAHLKDMNTHPSDTKTEYTLTKEMAKESRIVQRNVIYVIGIPECIANERTLSSNQYFGQYGEIFKLVIISKPHYTEKKKEKYYSGYITYTTAESACIAIIAIQSMSIRN